MEGALDPAKVGVSQRATPVIVRARPLGDEARDLVALTKPRVTALVVLTFGGAAWLSPMRMPVASFLVALFGTVIVVSAANALNMFLERDVDGLMKRTRNRPLPAERLRPESALAFGILLLAFSMPFLRIGANPLTALLGLLAFALYVFAYTPLKRRSWLALFVGAVPGAMPPLMGWTAATGRLDAGGLALFAVLFLWQIPHFIAISTFREDEYTNAGFRVFRFSLNPRAGVTVIAGFSALLVASTLVLTPLGVAGGIYFVAAAVLGAVFLGASLVGFWHRAPRVWARALFALSIVYLMLLFAALLLDHRLHFVA